MRGKTREEYKEAKGKKGKEKEDDAKQMERKREGKIKAKNRKKS